MTLQRRKVHLPNGTERRGGRVFVDVVWWGAVGCGVVLCGLGMC